MNLATVTKSYAALKRTSFQHQDVMCHEVRVRFWKKDFKGKLGFVPVVRVN